MPNLEAIGEAIGAAVQTISGTPPGLTEPTKIRVQQEFGESPNVSGGVLVAVVEYDGTTYDSAYGGQSAEVNYKVSVLGAHGSERSTRKRLLALCDPTPGSTTALATAVTGNLANTVVMCRAVSNTGLRDFNFAGGEGAPTHLGVEFTVAVMPT